jgi:hypothetical protein
MQVPTDPCPVDVHMAKKSSAGMDLKYPYAPGIGNNTGTFVWLLEALLPDPSIISIIFESMTQLLNQSYFPQTS